MNNMKISQISKKILINIKPILKIKYHKKILMERNSSFKFQKNCIKMRLRKSLENKKEININKFNN